MKPDVINLAGKLSLFTEQWSPKIIARMNDHHFKVVKLSGEFVWHAHEDTDEVFMVLKGELTIEFQDGEALLKPGEMIVVPKGVEHRPKAEKECHVLLVEVMGTVNTGDTDSDLTAPTDEWI
jgi:mannose-6-phosphate isomerase-like protein (cupin superfamily)